MKVFFFNCVRKISRNYNIRKMSVLTQQYNAITGKLEWELQAENYDWNQEVARSGYADMLHDTERNKKYYNGLKCAISQLKCENKPVKVLDIGTGTGLLSMMAIACGADHVTACEAFAPMAKCAVTVIEKNGMAGKINVIQKRSTELTVGKGCDLEEKANVLVTEVFDTELIGEGALSTFKHALENLLEPDCKVIPSSSKVYAQVIESETILNWHKAQPLNLGGDTLLKIPNDVAHCGGSAAVHDIQMSQLKRDDFTAITSPMVVHRLDFTGKSPLIFNESFYNKTPCVANGKCQAVFMWWDLEMTPGGETLSCAPFWAHPTPNEMQWRDHWMQAIYYLPKELPVAETQSITIGTHHDEYSYWFSVHKTDVEKPIKVDHPICNCGLHASYSRTRLGMMNDKERNKKIAQIFQKTLTAGSNCLCVGENIPLALIASKAGLNTVFVCEPNRIKREILRSYIISNGIDKKVTILQKDVLAITGSDLENKEINAVIAEPFFNSSILPWDSIHFWYIRSSLASVLAANVIVAPNRAVLKCAAVQFTDLYKIRAPVGHVEGFNLTAFDKLIQEAIDLTDASIEPQPLWEYPCVALTEAFDVLTCDFTHLIDLEKTLQFQGSKQFKSAGICNAVAIWVDYDFGDDHLGTGPIRDVIPGEEIEWYRYSQQGVYFFKDPIQVHEPFHSIDFECSFKPKSGTTAFSFKSSL